MFIANWKMNGSEAMLKVWLAEIKENLNQDSRSSCILCPPVCFISQASKIIQRDEKKSKIYGFSNSVIILSAFVTKYGER